MWVLPTRGRPDRCQATLDSLVESSVSTPGVVVVDGDDDPKYRTLRLPDNWDVVFRKTRGGVCQILNESFRVDPDQGWWGFLSDDSVVTHHGRDWDVELVLKAGDDGFANTADDFNSGPRMQGAVVFGGALLRSLGWWVPPGLEHSFCDDVWERLGRALGNWVFDPTTTVEHRHFLSGKAERDATNDLAHASFERDQLAFYTWLAEGGLDEAVARCAPLVNATRTLQERANNRVRRTPFMICTPVYRDVAWQYTRALVDTAVTAERSGVYHRVQMVIGNSNLPRARNELVAEFLASDCHSMIFVDSDMGWVANDIMRLVASEQHVIGAVGRKRVDKELTDPTSWCAWLLDNDHLVQDEAGAIQVGGIGTGFLKIDRCVFEKMAVANPALKRLPLPSMSEPVGSKFYDFFRFSDGPNGECVGEDYHFCQAWRNLGGSVWADPGIELLHVGSADFKGRFGDLLVEAPKSVESV